MRPRRAPAPIDPRARRSSARLPSCATRTSTGDETLQRKAFERVAGELGVERADELTLIARELAWSSRTPEDEEVEEFAEQARGAQEEGASEAADGPSQRRRAARRPAARCTAAAQRTSSCASCSSLRSPARSRCSSSSPRSAGAGRAAVFPEGTNTGVVALDMSASISGPIYARVATTLRGIVNANQSVGLVMFSDTAYELLPPNSPPGALLAVHPVLRRRSATTAARRSSARRRGTPSWAARASARA